jgi:hypothetical protein
MSLYTEGQKLYKFKLDLNHGLQRGKSFYLGGRLGDLARFPTVVVVISNKLNDK